MFQKWLDEKNVPQIFSLKSEVILQIQDLFFVPNTDVGLQSLQ